MWMSEYALTDVVMFFFLFRFIVFDRFHCQVFVFSLWSSVNIFKVNGMSSEWSEKRMVAFFLFTCVWAKRSLFSWVFRSIVNSLPTILICILKMCARATCWWYDISISLKLIIRRMRIFDYLIAIRSATKSHWARTTVAILWITFKWHIEDDV